jgi:hypothetical protein
MFKKMIDAQKKINYRSANPHSDDQATGYSTSTQVSSRYLAYRDIPGLIKNTEMKKELP